MAYNHEVSMAHIENIIEALNRHRGMHTCDDLMYLIWVDASPAQIERKINAPRNETLRTIEYARKQVRQEIRRTLYNYFNDVDESPYDIYRATAHRDSERFWIAEEQHYSVDVSGERSDIDVVVTATEQAPANLMEAIAGARAELDAEFIGRPNTPEVRRNLSARIESIITELGA